MKLESRDPQDLALHPARKTLPALPGWEKGGELFNALVENIRFRGMDKPLIIDAENRVIDGEARWRAARQLQLTEVPVMVRAESAASILLASAATKKRLPTQSALAFYSYPLFASAFAASREAQRRYFESHGRSANLHAVRTPVKAEDFADEIGIGRRYFFDARKVWDAFDKHPEPVDITDDDGEVHEGVTFREYYGRRILLGEVRLGAVIAGIAGHLHTKGGKKRVRKQLELFGKGFDLVAKRWRYWTDFDEAERRTAADKMREFVASMPDAVYDQMKRAVREREKGQTHP
jgi:hypothetical protein